MPMLFRYCGFIFIHGILIFLDFLGKGSEFKIKKKNYNFSISMYENFGKALKLNIHKHTICPQSKKIYESTVKSLFGKRNK